MSQSTISHSGERWRLQAQRLVDSVVLLWVREAIAAILALAGVVFGVSLAVAIVNGADAWFDDTSIFAVVSGAGAIGIGVARIGIRSAAAVRRRVVDIRRALEAVRVEAEMNEHRLQLSQGPVDLLANAVAETLVVDPRRGSLPERAARLAGPSGGSQRRRHRGHGNRPPDVPRSRPN